MTFTFPSISLLAAGAALLAGGCYYSDCPVQYSGQYRGQGYVEVDTAPPAPQGRVETRPAKPSASAEWVPGYWDWRDGWVWVDGHWETPRPGHVWEPPVARRTPGGRIQYHPGHFRPRDRRPPPVYREPSEVQVSVAGRAGARAGTVVPGETRSPTPDVRQGGTVRGATPETRRPPRERPAQEVRPGGTVRGGTVETREPTPEVEVRPGGTVRGGTPGTVRPRGGEVQGPEAETARPRPGGTVRGGSPETVQLGCQLTVSRAPRGASVTIRGTGFQDSAVVKVGGTIATVIRTSSERISFQVPRATGGGTVSVSVGEETASCGHLSVTGR